MADNEYKGPGKFWSTFGGWLIGGAVGGIVGTLMIMALPTAGMFLAAAAVGLTCNITGAVLGYKKAVRGQEQFEAMRMQNEARGIEIVEEKAKSLGVSRFTDRIQSRATHESHADTILAEQANAAHQTR